MGPKKVKVDPESDTELTEKGLLEFHMVFRQNRLDTFQSWPYDSGPCTAEKVKTPVDLDLDIDLDRSI